MDAWSATQVVLVLPAREDPRMSLSPIAVHRTKRRMPDSRTTTYKLAISMMVSFSVAWFQPSYAAASRDQTLVEQAKQASMNLDFEAAVRLANEALKINPNNIEARGVRGTNTFLSGKQLDAQADLEAYVNAKSAQGQWPYNETFSLSSIYAERRNFDKALQLADAIVKSGAAKKTDQLQHVYDQMGALYERKGNLEKAADMYDNAKEFQPFNVKVYLNYENVLEKLKDYHAAYDVLREAKELDQSKSKELTARRKHLGDLLYARGQKAVIGSHQKDFNGYVDGGFAFMLLDDPAPAWNAGMKCIQLKPQDPLGYKVLGDAYFQARMWERAAYQFNKAAQLDPKNDYYVERKQLAERNFAKTGKKKMPSRRH